MYFLIARRLFCLLRLCQFFRASCFTLVLLVRGLFADWSSGRQTFSHPRPSFRSCYFLPQNARNSDRLFDLSCGFRANQLSNSENHSCMKFLAENFNSLKHITCFSMMNYQAVFKNSIHAGHFAKLTQQTVIVFRRNVEQYFHGLEHHQSGLGKDRTPLRLATHQRTAALLANSAQALIVSVIKGSRRFQHAGSRSNALGEMLRKLR
jgi:hypothetical protein